MGVEQECPNDRWRQRATASSMELQQTSPLRLVSFVKLQTTNWKAVVRSRTAKTTRTLANQVIVMLWPDAQHASPLRSECCLSNPPKQIEGTCTHVVVKGFRLTTVITGFSPFRSCTIKVPEDAAKEFKTIFDLRSAFALWQLVCRFCVCRLWFLQNNYSHHGFDREKSWQFAELTTTRNAETQVARLKLCFSPTESAKNIQQENEFACVEDTKSWKQNRQN